MVTVADALDHARAHDAQASAALADPETLEAVVTACEQRLGLVPAVSVPVIVYKGIPTTVDALAHGIETLAFPGQPILQPAPEDAP